jgi:hypothetical protein
MPEWADFTTGQQMIDACQVPDGILESISVNGLIETCLDYPLLNNMFFYTSIQYGTEKQMENFNGFNELSVRSNAATFLLARYKLTDPLVPPEGYALSRSYNLHFIHFAMILAQPVFIQQLTSSERKELINEAINKYDVELRNPDTFGIIDLKAAALIMGRTMMAEDYKPFMKEVNRSEMMKEFLTNADIKDNLEILNIVLDHALKFLYYY